MALRMQKDSKGDWPLQTGSRFGRLHDGAPCSQLSELVAGFPEARIRNVGNGWGLWWWNHSRFGGPLPL